MWTAGELGSYVAHEAFPTCWFAENEAQEECDDDTRDTDSAQCDAPACSGVSEGSGDLPADGFADVYAYIQDALADEDVSPTDQVANKTNTQRLNTSLTDAHAQSRAE